MKKHLSKSIVDGLYFVFGAVIYSIALAVFLTPNAISPGGVTGIAAALNHITNIPTGLMLLLFNIPILVLGFFKMGGMFILKTTIVTILVSVGIDTLSNVLPELKTDGILAALFGGVLLGLGLSLVLLRGATTGGIDIIAKLIQRKRRYLSVGKIILIADAGVVAFNALIYKNAESALYSVVAIYTATRVMDILLYGADRGKIVYAVTTAPEKICSEINHQVKRGVTIIDVKGGYTGEKRTMLMCTVRIHEVAAVCDVIKECDKGAFLVISDAGEIIGEGFKTQDVV